MYDSDVPKHRKKKDQVSDSHKRSTHKHNYEKIILCNKWRIPFMWQYRCSVCGRLKSYSNNWPENYTDFLLPPAEQNNLHGVRKWYSFGDLVKKYSDIKFFQVVGHYPDYEYIQIH